MCIQLRFNPGLVFVKSEEGPRLVLLSLSVRSEAVQPALLQTEFSCCHGKAVAAVEVQDC